jgi:predicted nucleic acid-binding protein
VARLIVLDASVAIAALASDDIHHDSASSALAGAGDDDELVVAATTRAEVLVGPARSGGEALATAREFLDGCETIPIGEGVADAAAVLKAGHRALSLPDAITLVVAELIDADIVWTYDRRWRGLQSRVAIP